MRALTEIGLCEFLLPLDYHQASEGTIDTIGTPSAVCHSIGPRDAMVGDDWRMRSNVVRPPFGKVVSNLMSQAFLLVEEYDISLEKTATSSDPAIQLNQKLKYSK